jgi:hypothetical protein
VLGGRNVMIDAAVKLGCVCSGATTHARTKDAREFLASLEPPRATAPVVNENTGIELDLHRTFGLYVHFGETMTFVNWLRFDLHAGVGLQARFP